MEGLGTITEMTDFGATWSLIRGRYDDVIKDLNSRQLNWRLHDGTLTIGEMSLHLAGCEIWFIAQLQGKSLNEIEAKLSKAAVDGVINEKPFPFAESEITPEVVQDALARARNWVESAINEPDKYREIQIQSALGPIIDGTGTFARIGYHPGYHQGQVHMIRSAPGFPKEE